MCVVVMWVIQAKTSQWAWSRVANRVCVTSSLFSVAKSDSATLLSQHYPACGLAHAVSGQRRGEVAAEILGEFNRSSQRFGVGGACGKACGVDEGADGPIGDEVAGSRRLAPRADKATPGRLGCR